MIPDTKERVFEIFPENVMSIYDAFREENDF